MKKIFRVVLAFALFALLFSGCKNPVQGDTKFEGKWKYSSSNFVQNITFTGTTIQITVKNSDNKWTANKGTFTFTDSRMSSTITHKSELESTEAEAVARLIALPTPDEKGWDYVLTTKVTPNELVVNEFKFIKQ